jgi:hypothetical protein
MPFALIAVLIVIFAGFSTIYIATINTQHFLDSGERAEYLKELAEKESEKVKFLGEQAVLNALESDVIGSGFLWKISQDAYRNLSELLGPYFPPDGMTTENGYNIKVFNPKMTVSPIPFEYEDKNSLGMDAMLRSYVYFRTIGSAELLVTDLRTNARFNATVPLDNLIPSTRLFMMEQMVKFLTEANGDSSVGAEVAETVEYMLARRVAVDNGVITNMELATAINVAVFLEEIKFFHDYDEKAAAYFEAATGINFNNYVASRDLVDPAEIFPGPGSGDGSMIIDVSLYGKPFVFNGSRCDMAETSRTLQVDHGGRPFMHGTYPSNFITGFERKFGNKPKYMYLYEIDVQTYPIDIMVSVEESLFSEYKEQFTTGVALDLYLNVLDDYNSQDFIGEEIRILEPEYEYVIKEYANKGQSKATVELEISSASGIPLGDTGAFADIFLDDDFLGSFTTPPILENIMEGAHELRTVLNFPDGLTEFEYSFLNITPEGLLEGAFGNVLDVGVSFEGPDSTQFWELMSLVLNDQPLEKKMITAVEWIASVAGYPFPAGVDNIDEPRDRGVLGDWLGTFSDYIDSIPEVWDSSFSGFLNLAEMTVDFAYATLDMVEEIVNEGLNIGELVIGIGEDLIEVYIKDPNQRLVAKFALNFLESRISNLTLTIGDELVKNKILNGLKNIGDGLARISMAITIFKKANHLVEIFTGEVQLQLSDAFNITFEFAEIALKLWTTAVKLFSKLGKDCLAKLTLRIQRMSTVVLIVFMFVSELINNDGDILKTLESLFLGFDEVTISWYTAIITAVALKVVGPALSGAIATGVGVLVMVLVVIIMLILNWDEFAAWITNSLSYDQRDELKKSIKSSLGDTLDLIGKLNDMKPEGYTAQAKSHHNMYGEMLKRAYFAQHESESGKYLNLSNYAFDFYKANRDVGQNVPRIKCAVKLFWFISADFDDTYYPHGNNDAYAWISIDTIGRTNWELSDILDDMTSEKAEATVIDYCIYSYPNLDAYEAWQSDLNLISDFLSDSVDRFQGAMSRLKFLNLFPDPTAYSRDYGALIVDYESRTGLNSLDLRISSSSGYFRYAHDEAWHEGWAFTKHITPDSNDDIHSTVLIVKPGDYEIRALNPNTPISGGTETLTILNGQCTNHYIGVKKAFSFTLNNTYNGSVHVQFYRDGVATESREFSSPGNSSVAVQPGTETFESVVRWDTDGNASNGYEVVKSHYWDSERVTLNGIANFKFFSLAVEIGDPFATDNVKDVWT